jgi:hypothetical protein
MGGDLLALSIENRTLGVDSNPIAAHLAAANARAILNQEIEICTQDVAELELDGIAAWHIDPDRRSTGRRATSLDYATPDRATIDRLLAQMPHAAIKIAPATRVPDDWAAGCEREWISRDRECRQQVVWHGDLAEAPGQHRATIIRVGLGKTPPRTIVGQPDQSPPITQNPARFLFDVDPAVRAAHLTGKLAAEHNLQALASGPTYLTGDTSIANDAALACFEALELLPLRTRVLTQVFRTRHIGQLEIKKRGVDIDPEKLRRDLKLRGDDSATLLLTNIARRPMAVLARRIV